MSSLYVSLPIKNPSLTDSLKYYSIFSSILIGQLHKSHDFDLRRVTLMVKNFTSMFY